MFHIIFLNSLWLIISYLRKGIQIVASYLPSSYTGILSVLNLHRIRAWSHNTALSLYVQQMCYIKKKYSFPIVTHCLWLLLVLFLFWNDAWASGGGDMLQMSHLELSIPQFIILCTLTSCSSLINCHLLRKETFLIIVGRWTNLLL